MAHRGTSNKTSIPSASNNRENEFDLLSKEAEYQKLNQELEAQTSKLVKEAEEIMMKQENYLLNASRNSFSAGDFATDQNDEDVISISANDDKTDFHKALRNSGSFKFDADVMETFTDEKLQRRPVTQNENRTHTKTKKLSARRPKTAGYQVPRKSTVPMNKLQASNRAHVASLGDAVAKVERDMETVSIADEDLIDDLMPESATEMGSEAQIRFLKAKLRVTQEEFDKVTKNCSTEIEKRRQLQTALKSNTEENERLKKINKSQKLQIEKNITLLDDEKKKWTSTKTQSNTTMKELDMAKQEMKKMNITNKATEVRLNRALEDVEKYKSQLAKEKTAGKENLQQDKKEINHLQSENKRLERLQNEMTTIFKKQQKLINVLKRQVLHIEAAKLLSFTEQDFLKALDWDNK